MEDCSVLARLKIRHDPRLLNSRYISDDIHCLITVRGEHDMIIHIDLSILTMKRNPTILPESQGFNACVKMDLFRRKVVHDSVYILLRAVLDRHPLWSSTNCG